MQAQMAQNSQENAANEHKNYLESPLPISSMPPGIPYIIGNEAAERFSFYGMKGILVVFMTQYLLGRDGALAPMSEAESKEYFHYFVSAVYFFPILGALLSDTILGKYRTILLLSVIYCFGHLALALDETRTGLFWGLALIAIGSGGIKPCVSAHVGDQFGVKNQHLLARVFSWFYFSINLGAFTSTLMTPLLLEWYGPGWAFGVPGVLMFVATVLFWMGRNRFVHVPPGGKRFLSEAFSGVGVSAVLRLLIVYAFVAIFWSLFDQTGSAWVLQATRMDQSFYGMTILPSQLQAANPLMILALIPLFSYYIYPAIERIFPLTALRKIGIGLFLAGGSFAISALIEAQIVAGHTPHILWQLLPYLIITAAEVMVSITCLEFSYTQAPKTMKSVIMAVYLLSVSLGNLFTSFVNAFIQRPDGTVMLDGASYYWFFTGAMIVAAMLYVPIAMCYPTKKFSADGDDPADPYLTNNP
jgi:proton-dependent oligopeptide transporter, POT family